MTYVVDPNSAKPLKSIWFWVILILIWLDLSATFTGIHHGVGKEANPFYAPFTEAGKMWMVLGVAIYMAILVIWFHITPAILRAISAGFLITIHTWGAMSWIRNWIPQFEFFFDFFVILIGPPLLGSILTVWILLDSTDLLPWNSRIEWIDIR